MIELMDRHEAAEFLGISIRLLEYRTASGEVPGFCRPFGTTARWSRTALMAWIDAGCPQNFRKAPQVSAISEPEIDRTKPEADNAEIGSGNNSQDRRRGHSAKQQRSAESCESRKRKVRQ